jgi:hypothetical protein
MEVSLVLNRLHELVEQNCDGLREIFKKAILGVSGGLARSVAPVSKPAPAKSYVRKTPI